MQDLAAKSAVRKIYEQIIAIKRRGISGRMPG
jgi:hypothetical protein